MTKTTDVVLFEEQLCDNGKKIAIATLNSPRSLNALSGEMIDLLYPQLLAWQKADDIALVVLKGEGEKAFCAGGDIVHLYQEMNNHRGDYAPAIEEYFVKEYQLDYLIHSYNKPFVVWGGGIVMGGGLGMMVGASHRIVTESSRIAMPEISIGLYPDVGGSYFLNKMPDGIGLFLGLTGASINAADAKYSKLADYFISQDKEAQFVESLLAINWGDTVSLNHEKLSALTIEFEQLSQTKLPKSYLREHQALISQLVNADRLNTIVDNITSHDIDNKWFNRGQKSLKHGSPLSAQITYRQLEKGRGLTLADCFRMELNLSVKSGQFGEFVEGVRALLIDKDNQPKWRYSSIEEVDESTIDWFFIDKWDEGKHPLKMLTVE